MVSSLPCPNLQLNTKNLHSNALLSLPHQLKVVILKCFGQDFEFQKISCYTDLICLSWIQAVNKEFLTFVLEVQQKLATAGIITCLNIQNMLNRMWLEGHKFFSDSSITMKMFQMKR